MALLNLRLNLQNCTKSHLKPSVPASYKEDYQREEKKRKKALKMYGPQG